MGGCPALHCGGNCHAALVLDCLWFLVGWLWLASGRPLLAEVPQNAPPQKDTLQAVLDRIHDHAAGDAWQKEGWKDDAIEAYLDKLVATIAAATENKDLKLPVRRADVKPPDPNQRVPFQHEGQLLIGKDLKFQLASPLDRAGRRQRGAAVACAEDSVIVARHAVVGYDHPPLPDRRRQPRCRAD